MKRGSIFETDGIPRMSEALPLAMQHVVAMIVGCVTPAIIVSGAVPGGLSREDQVILIQSALVIAALSTLLQLFPIGGKAKFAIGSGLPIIMGVSFAYVPSMQAIAESYGIAAIMGAEIVGGIVAVVMGLLVKKIRVFFPPLITGTVVFTIGLSLYPTAINYMAGGTSSPNYGSWQNWAIAFFTLIVVTALNHFGKGIWKLASILIGIIVGYLVSIPFGMVDFSSIGEAGVCQLPSLMHFGVQFEPSSCVALGILFAINSIQAIGDYSATTIGAMDRTPKDDELQRGIVGRRIARRTSHSNIQPERWYCYNYKGYQPLGTGTCSCNSRYSRSGSEILSYPDNDSSVCTGWCNCVCICIDCNDRYEAGCFC